ncbi:mRNA 3' end processing factor, partial [Quaeritorhiza haematococci]
MDAHLDWHFRQNRRLKEKAKKAVSRDWFVSEEDWVSEREVDAKSRQAAPFQDHVEPVVEKEEEPVSNIPAEGDKIEPCAICNEAFEKFWDEEEEDWMLRNAVKQDGKLYHQTCWRDQQKKLARTASKSPPTTPPTVPATASTVISAVEEPTTSTATSSSSSSISSPSSLLGKRKHEDDAVPQINGNALAGLAALLPSSSSASIASLLATTTMGMDAVTTAAAVAMMAPTTTAAATTSAVGGLGVGVGGGGGLTGFNLPNVSMLPLTDIANIANIAPLLSSALNSNALRDLIGAASSEGGVQQRDSKRLMTG